MKSTATGVKRIFKAFGYSFAGFCAAFKSEAAFRQDLAVFVAGTAAAVYFDFTLTQKALLISALLLILLMELTNTAIEYVVDRISDDYHELSKKAKDTGSLLVLIAFVNAILIWGAVVYSAFFA